MSELDRILAELDAKLGVDRDRTTTELAEAFFFGMTEEGEDLFHAMWTLSLNLKTAAGLCKSYAMGWLACRVYDSGDGEWFPGCGRPFDDR